MFTLHNILLLVSIVEISHYFRFLRDIIAFASKNICTVLSLLLKDALMLILQNFKAVIFAWINYFTKQLCLQRLDFWIGSRCTFYFYDLVRSRTALSDSHFVVKGSQQTVHGHRVYWVHRNQIIKISDCKVLYAEMHFYRQVIMLLIFWFQSRWITEHLLSLTTTSAYEFLCCSLFFCIFFSCHQNNTFDVMHAVDNLGGLSLLRHIAKQVKRGNML